TPVKCSYLPSHPAPPSHKAIFSATRKSAAPPHPHVTHFEFSRTKHTSASNSLRWTTSILSAIHTAAACPPSMISGYSPATAIRRMTQLSRPALITWKHSSLTSSTSSPLNPPPLRLSSNPTCGKDAMRKLSSSLPSH